VRAVRVRRMTKSATGNKTPTEQGKDKDSEPALPQPMSINEVQLASCSGSKLPPAPSAALFGLSLIGNLDNIYTQSSYARPPSSSLDSSSSSSIKSPSDTTFASFQKPIPPPTQIMTIHTVTTASRQKPGGFLLLEHTFNKKLWLHLCWDVNGFEEGHVERFWECLRHTVEELVISDD